MEPSITTEPITTKSTPTGPPGAAPASEDASEHAAAVQPATAESEAAESEVAKPEVAAKSEGTAAKNGAQGSTPIRRQYLEIKARHPDAILFFRLGDFYETFDEDAELCSRELDIVLTSKPMGKGLRVPLAGVPAHSVDQYLGRLIERGHRVALCEQLEDAKATKGLVARGVVRVVSPGTALEAALLEAGASNYCAALWQSIWSGQSDRPEQRDGPKRGRQATEFRAGIAAVDLSTGEFRCCELEAATPAGLQAAVEEELARLGVRELLLPEEAPFSVGGDGERSAPGASGPPHSGLIRSARPSAAFGESRAADKLCRQFGVDDVEGLGLAGHRAALRAAGALVDYLAIAQPPSPEPPASASEAPPDGAPQPALGAVLGGLKHLDRPRLYEPSAAMQLDPATQRALSIFEGGRAAGPGSGQSVSGRADGSLAGLLDRCQTAPGRRLLHEWLARPLLDLEAIEARLDRVALLATDPIRRRRLGEALEQVPDLERLMGRTSTGLARPPEVARLGAGLRTAANLRQMLPGEKQEQERRPGQEGNERSGTAAAIRAELQPCSAAEEAIAALLNDDPPADFEEGGVVRPGVDADLDRWRAQLREARAAIAALEDRERVATGIGNLKVGYHRTFGYYLEVTSSHVARVPESWQRRQTLAGGERYVTEELRGYERRALEARGELASRERDLFQRLCRQLSKEAAPVRALAAGVARLDVAWSLAETAAARGWTRPRLDHSDVLELRAARHPIVEAALETGAFVPNDLRLRSDGDQILLITGPNMAGKSTYLRQTALIVLLAQIGAFVPAASARIGLTDRIFARVGAQDDLAAGQSTFMVEMLETAAILAAATPRSLLILDEIGRGTSTYDGLAIAQAVVEHLAGDPLSGPRTLFATHFHEMMALAGSFTRVVNATVAVAETDSESGGDSTAGDSPAGNSASGDSASGGTASAGAARGKIEFLYRIVPGGADRSYGVHVAEMAGLPAPLLARARQILAELERKGASANPEGGLVSPPIPGLQDGPSLQDGPGSQDGPSLQGSLFAAGLPLQPSQLLAELGELDVDNLTPLEAMGALYALRGKARREIAELGEGS